MGPRNVRQKHSVSTKSRVEPEQVNREPTWVTTLTQNREITVQYFDGAIGRVVLGKVSPEMYITLWDAGYLHFQRSGVKKPNHLPTREEVATFL